MEGNNRKHNRGRNQSILSITECTHANKPKHQPGLNVLEMLKMPWIEWINR